MTGQLSAGHVSSTSPRWGGFDMSSQKRGRTARMQGAGQGDLIGFKVSSGTALAVSTAPCQFGSTWPANVSNRVASCCETRHQNFLTTQCIQENQLWPDTDLPSQAPPRAISRFLTIPPPLRCPSLFEAAVCHAAICTCCRGHGAVRGAGVMPRGGTCLKLGHLKLQIFPLALPFVWR